jgi:hypothetical protein
MMRSLRSRHSWPPSGKSRSFQIDKKMDEDPFAYFISPADDRDVDFDIDLEAGIRDGRWRSRSSSPRDSRRNRKFRKASSHAADAPTSSFKRWIERMEKQYFHRRPSSHTVPLPGPLTSHPPPTSPPLRGRPCHRAGTAQHVPQLRRTPARRPRSWREPSLEIWPVLEEQEDGG